MNAHTDYAFKVFVLPQDASYLSLIDTLPNLVAPQKMLYDTIGIRLSSMQLMFNDKLINYTFYIINASKELHMIQSYLKGSNLGIILADDDSRTSQLARILKDNGVNKIYIASDSDELTDSIELISNELCAQ